VYESVLEAQRRLLASPRLGGERAPVVLTCCFTGQGNAELLKKVVQRMLRVRGLAAEVVAASLPPAGTWDRLFSTLLQGRRPVAVVGPVNPGLPDVSYFSSAEILTREGQDRLAALLDRLVGNVVPERLTDRRLPADDLARALAAGVEENFNLTNPYTLMPEAVRAADALADAAGVQLPADVRIGLIMHIACLTERRARETGAEPAPEVVPELELVARCLAPLCQRFHVQFLPDDLVTIREMLQDVQYTPGCTRAPSVSQV